MHCHTCTQFITFAYEILILVLYTEVGSNQFIPGGITLHNSLLKASKATDLYEMAASIVSRGCLKMYCIKERIRPITKAETI